MLLKVAQSPIKCPIWSHCSLVMFQWNQGSSFCTFLAKWSQWWILKFGYQRSLFNLFSVFSNSSLSMDQRAFQFVTRGHWIKRKISHIFICNFYEQCPLAANCKVHWPIRIVLVMVSFWVFRFCYKHSGFCHKTFSPGRDLILLCLKSKLPYLRGGALPT